MICNYFLTCISDYHILTKSNEYPYTIEQYYHQDKGNDLISSVSNHILNIISI